MQCEFVFCFERTGILLSPPSSHMTSKQRRIDVDATSKQRRLEADATSKGSIPLNIHEVWLRPFSGEAYGRKKIPVDHFISHIPLLYKKLIKDQIY